MDVKIYEVYSEKYGVKGTIYDFNILVKLHFNYGKRERVMSLERPFPECGEAAYQALGQKTMDSVIEKILSGEIKERTLMLHHWYVDEIIQPDEEKYQIAHGIVSGHGRLQDATDIHTSMIERIIIDEANQEALIHTRNSIYHCPLSSCDFRRQDRYPELIPDYEALKQKYRGTTEYPTIEPGKVLLVLSNFDHYYFNSIYYREEGKEEPEGYESYPHIGMVQDSYLIDFEDVPVRISYFPHFQNIEIYGKQTAGKPLFVENIGDVTLYVQDACGIIRLDPGERKQVCEENAETDELHLPGGDLYPAAIL